MDLIVDIAAHPFWAAHGLISEAGLWDLPSVQQDSKGWVSSRESHRHGVERGEGERPWKFSMAVSNAPSNGAALLHPTETVLITGLGIIPFLIAGQTSSKTNKRKTAL